MPLLTAREIMDQTCSDNVLEALEEVNRYLRRLSNTGRGQVDFEGFNNVDIKTTFDDSEEKYFLKAMHDAGWVSTRISGTFVSFYFPS